MKGSTFNQLMIFHAIAREGSITKAATKLELANPSVSNALKSLENELGLPLFTRTTRRIELTEAGRQLYEKTRPSIDELSFAVEGISDLARSPSGKVRMTVPRFVYQFLLQPVYAEFCITYPDIELEISISDAAVDILKEGFDLGIRFGDRVEQGMVAKPLSNSMHEALFVSPAYAKRFGIPKQPDDLVDHQLIQYRFITSNQIAPLILHSNGESLTVSTKSALVVNDTDVMLDAARRGLGIGRIVEPMVASAFERGELIPVLKDFWCPYSPLYIYFHQNTQKAKRVRALIDFLVAKSQL